MENKVFEDDRGFNMKFFENDIAEKYGFNKVKEVFATTNKKGVVRAFHYQDQPRPQQKIVKVLSGRFNAKVVDMHNETIIEYDNIDNESAPILVKEGNMLGYVSLEENSVMLYIADEEFIPELNCGVNPFSFYVDWKYDGELIINKRDNESDVVTFESMQEQNTIDK